MSRLLLDERPLVVLPALAEKVGLNEAIILQQIHYWLQKENIGKCHDGKKWVRNTYEEWQENFPFWSTRTIRRIIKSLKEADLIRTARLNKRSYDKTNWYTINYEEVARLDKMDSGTGQNGQSDVDKMSEPIPETTQRLHQRDNTPQPEPKPQRHGPEGELMDLLDRSGVVVGSPIQKDQWLDILEITDDMSLIEEAFVAAAKQMKRPTPSYIKSILDRCLRQNCRPDEWPERDNGGKSNGSKTPHEVPDSWWIEGAREDVAREERRRRLKEEREKANA